MCIRDSDRPGRSQAAERALTCPMALGLLAHPGHHMLRRMIAHHRQHRVDAHHRVGRGDHHPCRAVDGRQHVGSRGGRLARPGGAGVTAPALTIRAVEGIPEINPGDDLAGIIATAAAAEPGGLLDGDVVVVTQKVVSKAEGQLVAVDPDGGRRLRRRAPALRKSPADRSRSRSAGHQA